MMGGRGRIGQMPASHWRPAVSCCGLQLQDAIRSGDRTLSDLSCALFPFGAVFRFFLAARPSPAASMSEKVEMWKGVKALERQHWLSGAQRGEIAECAF